MNRNMKQIPGHDVLLSLVPRPPDWNIDWSTIWSLWPDLGLLDHCPQDPIYHAEGDVGIHTRMVVEALVGDEAWKVLDQEQRSIMFWAAILHDIGKPATTKKEEGGRITSRGHSRIGAAIARHLLWLAGSPFSWREAVCGIIAHHQLPFWLIERENARRLAIETSWECHPENICLHARADAIGRKCSDQAGILENVTLAQTVFEEAQCLQQPFHFANDESRVAFFERDDRNPFYEAHEEFRCQVTVMSGLPGSGKDYWIGENRPEHPVVSLDGVREELEISATDNQGRVIQAARERAREYLRAKKDFVWNATNTTRLTRRKILQLLRDYGARIHLVYIEAHPEQLHQQNKNRKDAVPESVITHLARKLEPPQPWEAHELTIVV